MSRPARIYRLHGLSISTIRELPAPSVQSRADVQVHEASPRPPTRAQPSGTLVAGRDDFYAATSGPTGHLLRFYGWCDFHLDPEMVSLTCLPHVGSPDGYEDVLLGGSVMAWLLALRGFPTLHASAVSLEGGVVAIGGPSNAGKSSIAVMATSRSGLLVTDDVLRIDPDRRLAFRGTTQVRVRSEVAHLAGLPGLHVQETPDGRFGVTPSAVSEETAPLRAIVLPTEAEATTVTTLSTLDALTRLIGLARLVWRSEHLHRQHLESMAVLARHTAIVEVAAPWREIIQRADCQRVEDLLCEASST